jgi:hypothetical protein
MNMSKREQADDLQRQAHDPGHANGLPPQAGDQPQQAGEPGSHAEDSQTNRLRRLRRDSDALLDDIDAVRRLEEIKREYPVSTPEFHYLANEIERRSREVFRLAERERAIGEQTDPGVPIRTRDVDP